MDMASLSNWRAERRKHQYPDGVRETWCVVADGRNSFGGDIRVRVADWIDEDTARLVAAAPELLAALEVLHGSVARDREAHRMLGELIARASNRQTP